MYVLQCNHQEFFLAGCLEPRETGSMSNLKTALALTVATLVGIGAAFSASAQDTKGNAAQKCEVVINRSQQAGVYDLTREVSQSGDCTCYVYTGPSPQSVAIENNLSALLRSKTCANAKVMNVPGGPGTGAAVGSIPTRVLLTLAAMGVVGVGLIVNGNGTSP